MKNIIVSLFLVCASLLGGERASQMLLVGAGGGSSAIPVDLYLDMQNGNNGDLITTTIAGNVTHGSGCTYSITPSPLTRFFVSTAYAFGAMTTPVSVSGTVYTGASETRTWEFRLINTYTGNEDVQCNVTTNSQIVSAEIDFITTLDGTSNKNHDFLELYANSGSQDCVLQLKDNVGGGTNFAIVAEGVTSGSSTTAGSSVAISTATPYSVFGLYDSVAGSCTAKVYSGTTLVGTSSGAVISTGINLSRFRIGDNLHAGNTADARYIRLSNLRMDWTNHRTPLH